MAPVMTIIDVDVARGIFRTVVFDVGVVVGEGVGHAVINVVVLGGRKWVGGLLLWGRGGNGGLWVGLRGRGVCARAA